MWTQPGMLGRFILGIPRNRDDSIFRTTQELTEDITALFLLLYTADHIGVNQYGIHDAKVNDDKNTAIADINDSNSGSCAEKYSVDDGLTDEEVEEIEESWK